MSSTDLKKKQYGLILKGPNTAKAPPERKVAAVFEDDDGDEQTVSVDVIRDAHKSASTFREVRQAERLHERALAEDPHVFDYDASYEEIQAKKNEKVADMKAKDKERKSKYAEAIMKSHKRRQLEQASVDERKQQKERVAEGEEFADKEVFVTGAYRDLMEEVQKLREEEAYEARFNSLTDVQKQKIWQAGFHRQLLNDIARSDEPKTSKSEAEPEKKEPEKKERNIRKRLDSDEDAPTTTATVKEEPKKSIYSDDEDDAGPPKNFKGDLKPGLNKVVKKEKALTKAERLKERMFTPSPEASDNEEAPRKRRDSPSERHKRRDDSKERRRRSGSRDRDRRRHRDDSKERKRDDRKHRDDSKERKKDGERRRDEKTEKVKEEEKEIVVRKPVRDMDRKERLENLRKILKQRNGREEIAEFRTRYLERKATGFVTVPL